ncbi:hypothetical protein CI105_08525 [Candidatus Izimaplasma bacterium ZiA1]|uniref:hypothetical protein n=1 Tax=Candidatus Izimoplasma sp. ZiA1 TaxID=2024899 RepID=UPI000BAA87A2|nr:hypothetical protein CI105_08525 [Candidatus Izimaplasma bacterium ZiA1]
MGEVKNVHRLQVDDFFSDFNSSVEPTIYNFYGKHGCGKSEIITSIKNDLKESVCLLVNLEQHANAYDLLKKIRNQMTNKYKIVLPLYDYAELIYINDIGLALPHESTNSFKEYLGSGFSSFIPLADVGLDLIYKIGNYTNKKKMEKDYEELQKAKEYSTNNLLNLLVRMLDKDIKHYIEKESKSFFVILEDYDVAFNNIFMGKRKDHWLTSKSDGILKVLKDFNWIITSVNEIDFKRPSYFYKVSPFTREEAITFLNNHRFFESDVLDQEKKDYLIDKVFFYTHFIPSNMMRLISIMTTAEGLFDYDKVNDYKDEQTYLNEFLSRFTAVQMKIVYLLSKLRTWRKGFLEQVILKDNPIEVFDIVQVKEIIMLLKEIKYLEDREGFYYLDDSFATTVLQEADEEIDEMLLGFYKKISSIIIHAITTEDLDEIRTTGALTFIDDVTKYKFVGEDFNLLHDFILLIDKCGSDLEYRCDLRYRNIYSLAYKVAYESYEVYDYNELVWDIRNCAKVLTRVYTPTHPEKVLEYNKIFIDASIEDYRLKVQFKRITDHDYKLIDTSIYRFAYNLINSIKNVEELYEIFIEYFDKYINYTLNYVAIKRDYKWNLKYLITRLRIAYLLETSGLKEFAYLEYYIIITRALTVDVLEQDKKLRKEIYLYAIYRMSLITNIYTVQSIEGYVPFHLKYILMSFEQDINVPEFKVTKEKVQLVLKDFSTIPVANDEEWTLEKLKVLGDNITVISAFGIQEDLFNIEFED